MFLNPILKKLLKLSNGNNTYEMEHFSFNVISKNVLAYVSVFKYVALF